MLLLVVVNANNLMQLEIKSQIFYFKYMIMVSYFEVEIFR